MRIFTIGFTKKSAEEFFALLESSGVKRIIDVRLNNTSQLAGFTKGSDLSYFLNRIGDIEYSHNTELAPTKEIMDAYKNKSISWEQYKTEFLDLLDKRAPQIINETKLLDDACLLCSEDKPDHCHRRLVAEYIQKANPMEKIEIIHI